MGLNWTHSLSRTCRNGSSRSRKLIRMNGLAEPSGWIVWVFLGLKRLELTLHRSGYRKAI